MLYDFELIIETCEELGLRGSIRSKELLEIELEAGVTFCFVNSENENDCLAGFKGTPWHTHGSFVFDDSKSCLEMDYLDVLLGLSKGEVLVCEQWLGGQLKDRWLTHSEYNDELRYLDKEEEIRIRRV